MCSPSPVVIFHVFVFGLRVPVRYRGNSSANTFLEKQVHVAIRKKFEFDVRHLQHGVPGQGWRGDVVGGIKLIFLGQTSMKLSKTSASRRKSNLQYSLV